MSRRKFITFEQLNAAITELFCGVDTPTCQNVCKRLNVSTHWLSEHLEEHSTTYCGKPYKYGWRHFRDSLLERHGFVWRYYWESGRSFVIPNIVGDGWMIRTKKETD